MDLRICRTPHPQNRRVQVFQGLLRPRRSRWADARFVGVSAFFAVILQALFALALINPHDENAAGRCLSCHTREMVLATGAPGNPLLLRDSIDGLCLICHLRQDCCKTGQEHSALPGYIGHSHPSDLDVRSISRASRPKTLPLQNDRITCNTCHLHDRQKPDDYKLVRLAQIKATGVNWTALCHDCHGEY